MNFRSICFAYIILAPLAALAGADLAAAEETRPAGYYLSVDRGGPGAADLLRGDYEAAISAARYPAQSGRNLSAYLTLCAAYIRGNALDAAIAACDSAVNLANAPLTTMRVPFGHKSREGLAKAHLNRGVLRTVLGELEAARADFEFALRQDRQLEGIRHNLQLNESLMTAARIN